MKRIICFAVCVVFAVLTASAQQVLNLDKLVKDGTSFVAYAGAEALPINPYLYKRVKANPADYVLVVCNAEKGTVRTLAQRSCVSYAVLSVDSVGYDEGADLAEVYLSDKTVYKSHNELWLKVLNGQHVERWLIDGETKGIQHFRTVGRDVPVTTTVPIANATTLTREVAQVTKPTTVTTTAQVTKPTTVVTTATVKPTTQTTQSRPALVRR